VSTAGRRLLFTAAGGHGHLQPLLPIAGQAAADGHEVLVTGAASLAGYVAARGLEYVPTGPDLRPIHAPLVVHDVDQERAAVGAYFVSRLGRARAAALVELFRSWGPDVVIHDEVDFGSVVAAEALHLPHAAVNVIGAGGFILPSLVNEPLVALLDDFGVDTQADLTGLLHRYLTLTPFPVRFRDPLDPLPGRVITYGAALAEPMDARSVTTVFVTLGTIFNTESGHLLGTAARGAAGSPLVDRVIVATGDHVDHESLRPLPETVTVARFVQQDLVLAECAAVVSHAGSGTVLGAMRHGLPHVCLPMGADQHLNAQRLQVLGLGVSLRADTTNADEVQSAVEDVLTSPSFRRNAAAMRNELRALPGVPEAVQALAGLAG
jgi:UDP:flavonoid glycosyltransferase YjiC (YdhE family)